MTEQPKRRPCQVATNGLYLVIDESARKPDGGWRHRCGTDVAPKQVSHPVHDGPFPLSGSGEVRVETVPFCPTCEEEPSPFGLPIVPAESRRRWH